MEQNLPEEPTRWDSKPTTTGETIVSSSNSHKVDKAAPPTALSVEEFNAKSQIERKNKILEFSFKFLRTTICVILAVVICDIIIQSFGKESELLKNFFELLKYCVTTTLGYLFAKESN